jgi:hypothetical protein
MTIDDPGWQGGLTPPAPQASSGNNSKVLYGGIGVAVLAVVVVVILLVSSGGSKGSAKSAGHLGSSGTTSTAGTGSGSGGSSSSGGNSGSGGSSSSGSSSSGGPTTPVLGVQVSASKTPATGAGGTQVTYKDSGGNFFPVAGVTIQNVLSNVSGTPTPAARFGLVSGDIIWGISLLTDSKITPVNTGQDLSTFLTSYLPSSGKVYLYYYSPATGEDFANNPPEIVPIEVSGRPTVVDCTSIAGC